MKTYLIHSLVQFVLNNLSFYFRWFLGSILRQASSTLIRLPGLGDANILYSAREYQNITEILQGLGEYQLLQEMNNVWPNSQGTTDSFWAHGEWSSLKIVDCISNGNFTNFSASSLNSRMGQAWYLFLYLQTFLLQQL
jgi:hypothetical protein